MAAKLMRAVLYSGYGGGAAGLEVLSSCVLLLFFGLQTFFLVLTFYLLN